MNKEQLILKQVSLKAAANLGGSVDDVLANAEKFNAWLNEGVDQNVVTTTPGNSAVFEPKCPSCDSFVWDNRDSASGNQPVWRCKNDECTGGTFSKKYNKQMAWASWDIDEFYNLEQAFNKENAKAPEVEEVIENPMTDDAKDVAPF